MAEAEARPTQRAKAKALHRIRFFRRKAIAIFNLLMTQNLLLLAGKHSLRLVQDVQEKQELLQLLSNAREQYRRGKVFHPTSDYTSKRRIRNTILEAHTMF